MARCVGSSAPGHLLDIDRACGPNEASLVDFREDPEEEEEREARDPVDP